MQQTFKTQNITEFTQVLVDVVKSGLTFESYVDGSGHYIIEFTGGF